MLAIGLIACSNNPKAQDQEKAATHKAEHETHEHDGDECEESVTQLSLDQVYDEVRKGTHLVLSYDAEGVAFTGTVENVSDEIMDRVRVDVHLSNGSELGPNTQVELAPGEKRSVKLSAEGEEFESWSTHAEVGGGEHSHEGDSEHGHEGENSHEGEGEHSHSHEGGGHEHN